MYDFPVSNTKTEDLIEDQKEFKIETPKLQFDWELETKVEEAPDSMDYHIGDMLD